jgi:DNA segregation ATPase FtsK/SpoIIIE, S-DNA-T family
MGVKLFAPRTVVGSALPPAAEPMRGALGRPFGRYREAAALLLFTSAAFLVLALGSLRVDPSDPTVGERNWVGPVGAAFAGFLVQGFGLVAWLAPIELALMGAPLFRGRAHSNLGLRVAGDLVVAVVLAALLQVAAPGTLVFGQAPVGGNVGLLFGELMREFFSTAGSFLIGPTVVGLILIGRASFSFIALCQRSVELALRLSARLSAACRKLFSAWIEARALRRAEIAEAQAQRVPRIETHDDDAAILMHLEDDESDWIPIEQTGAPPLALSQALKNTRPADFSILLENSDALAHKLSPAPDLDAEPEAAAQPEPEPEPQKTRRRRKALAEKPPEPPPEPEEEEEEEEEQAEVDEDEAAGEEEEEEETEGAAEDAEEEEADDGVASEPRIVDTQQELKVERPVRRIVAKKGTFALPSPELLDTQSEVVAEIDRDKILEHAGRLEKTLLDYGVVGKVEEIHPGPTVTTYEVACNAGTKVSKVASLADDLALGLSRKVRIIAPIPGKSRIGFELPNDERVPVNLRELIEDQRFDKLAERAPLPVVLGRDIVGAPFYADLASMPHVIVAGATGAGKSVGLNVMLSSLLFKRSPEELRMLMIDPKVVELAPFDGIPHMLLPVVTDMKQAATALRWAVDEMERRYQLFANAGTKNITTYNAWVKRVHDGEAPAPKAEEVEALTADGALVTVPAAKTGGDGVALPGKLAYIVIVVDEFADLMMQQGKEVEASVARLAQKARAAGMHVVLATQRPSVDVITGMIKANFPTRIGFRVAQKVDSRTILDEQGAELLLGRGDMLVKLNGQNDTRRVQCPFVSEEEVERLTSYLRTQGAPEYHEAILTASDDEADAAAEDDPADTRFDEAVLIVRETQRCSTSWLQRKMTIGYNRAAKIVEMMEKRGMVGPPNGAREREVLLFPG